MSIGKMLLNTKFVLWARRSFLKLKETVSSALSDCSYTLIAGMYLKIDGDTF